MTRLWIFIAAVGGAGAVIADAAARHGTGGDAQAAEWFATGARYGLIHAVALLALAILPPSGRRAARGLAAVAGWSFGTGMVLFSGGLYGLALGWGRLLPVVPVGGTLFILGWVALALHAVLRGRS